MDSYSNESTSTFNFGGLAGSSSSFISSMSSSSLESFMAGTSNVSSEFNTGSDLKQMLESNRDDVKLEAMKCITTMTAKGKTTLPKNLFPHIVKNVSSKNAELRKLVYLYLTSFADQEPDLALLSIASIQKSLKNPNPLVRASALRVLTSMRLNILSVILMATVKNSVNDLSPYVKKTVAHAIVKIYRLDPECRDELIEYIQRLLQDKNSMVISSAVVAFEVVCPEKLELIQKHFRKFCSLLADCSEWGQVILLNLLTRYGRSQFMNSASGGTGADSDTSGLTVDQDHRLLLRSAKPLLQSNNSSVVLAVVQLYQATAPHNEIRSTIVRPLVRLLHSHREIQLIILSLLEDLTSHRYRDSMTTTDDGDTTTNDGGSPKNDGSTTKDDGDTTTNDGGSTTTNDGSTTKDDGDTTKDDGVTTTNDGSTTTNDGSTTKDDGDTTTNDGVTTKDDGSFTTDDGSTTTEGGGTKIDHGGTTTNDGGTTTDDGGTSTDDDGTSTDDDGTSTDDAGTTTDDGATTTDDGGTKTDDGGTKTDEEKGDGLSYRDMFQPYLKSFFIKPTDCTQVRVLKLQILNNLSSSANISLVLKELQAYIVNYVDDAEFISATVQAIGTCASTIKEVAHVCLNGLTSLLSNKNEIIVSEAIVVLRSQIINKDDNDATASTIIKQVTKLLPTITTPQARATILWILAEYCNKNDRAAKCAPNVLRQIAKTFCSEDSIVKLQAINLAAKLLLSVDKEEKKELHERLTLLANYIFSLAKYDLNYDVRDRVRFLKQLISDEKLSFKILIRKSPVQRLSSDTGHVFLFNKG